MNRPPHSLRTGIFDAEFLGDMVVYGVWIAVLCFARFMLVVYRLGGGDLGEGCNESCPDSCRVWAVDIWRDRFLSWAIMVGFITMFPIIYIPGLNTVVSKHVGISCKWGIVLVCAALFFAAVVEAWKWAKRVILRRRRPEGHECQAAHFFRLTQLLVR
ncbi:Uu.00g108250.m01.CDS01 [Anthostomella pinea]|uniref:Uu.00g108250.m01.CDS01 n=1 Tax=Anthostomella pinea TaxID=933095 RepID=A0AAI8YDM7_9PEZI|nr:Uu.00g108250.m01.CDS01 [Anthostomella pinea]